MNYEFCNGYTYTIKQGDTLYEISKKLEVPLALILRANPYVDVFNLQIGDTLCIPARERPLPLPPVLPGQGRPEPDRPGQGRPEPNRPLLPETSPEPGRPQPEPGSGRPLPPLPPPPNVRMSEDEDGRSSGTAEEDAWIRYVVQPGDTMSELVKDQKLLQMFIGRNGLENIYLLPGVAYYVPER
ncbi:MAG: LysM peptidoglycan-binding domain-containing protein [Lachnospiraceae bacterium]|nr:LysM peptidoglycan-binding domain-containing protein [Lachnospiraceae bacterium]